MSETTQIDLDKMTPAERQSKLQDLMLGEREGIDTGVHDLQELKQGYTASKSGYAMAYGEAQEVADPEQEALCRRLQEESERRFTDMMSQSEMKTMLRDASSRKAHTQTEDLQTGYAASDNGYAYAGL